MGRLFDALSSLLDVCIYRSYEGEPAILLEAIADETESGTYPVPLEFDALSGAPVINGPQLLLSALNDLNRLVPVSSIAARFHNTLANATALAALAIGQKWKITDVCLTGGCFQNALLLERTILALKKQGLTPYVHRLVPPNDESISYGQTVIAGMRREKRFS